MSVPQTKEELMAYAVNDPKYIVESGFYVVNKEKEIVPFIFNNLQSQFYDEKSGYDDVLKASQIGFSTMFMALFTIKFLLVPNAWCVSISYEADATARMFSKVKFFLDHLPAWLQPFLHLSTDRTGTLVNEVMNSRFYIGTAGKKTPFGRGDTIHYAHLSEISRWGDNGTIATNILRAAPKTGDVWIVKETTANGEGNYHHREWIREINGNSRFKPHFFPWFRHEEYTFGEGVEPLEDYDEDERQLINMFPDEIDDGRLRWRREMISTLGSEDGIAPEDIFKQEFPSTWQEAFLHSGNPVFPVKKLARYGEADLVREPVMVGNLIGIPPNETIDETKQGWYEFYDMPATDGQYLIFADTAQYDDWCSAHVLDRKTWEIVATFHAHIQAHPFGDELNKLGYFFNTALIAVEVNNMGQSTIDRLVTLNYPALYMRKRLDRKKKKETKEVGWMTTGKTKPLMIGHMQQLLRSEQIPFIDDPTRAEMRTFVRKENGKMEASEGNNDDRVISICGAYYVLKLHPYTAPKNQTKQTSVRKLKKYKKFRSTTRVRNKNRRRLNLRR